MRQIFWINGILGSMDEDPEIKEKCTAHKVCNYAVHSGISGKRKGTRQTMPFISNVVWSCLAEGAVKYCPKSLALGVDIGR